MGKRVCVVCVTAVWQPQDRNSTIITTLYLLDRKAAFGNLVNRVMPATYGLGQSACPGLFFFCQYLTDQPPVILRIDIHGSVGKRQDDNTNLHFKFAGYEGDGLL